LDPPPGTFRSYLDQKADWENYLFHSLELQLNPFQLLEGLLQLPFSCTSDGSVCYQREGSFGWAFLSFQNGDRPVHCSGPVYGFKPTSYRAKGYAGLLSMIRFLRCLPEYCGNIQPLHAFKMTSDNTSLVDNAIAFQADNPSLDLPLVEPLD
jgi:hypothetical protein